MAHDDGPSLHPMRLDLNLVEVFCCVVEEGSFSRAARKLSLSQPTVSGHIRNLEGFVGTPLLDRLPRRIKLTQAGELLFRHGRAILHEKKAAVIALTRFVHHQEGGLILCGSTIPAEYILPRIVSSFHARFPRVKVEIRISDSKGACDEVLSARAELGFVGAKFPAVELEFRPFASDDLALVVPNTREWAGIEYIALDALSQKPFLLREAGSGTRSAFEEILGRSLDSFNVVGCFGSTNAVKEALKANLGVSILSVLAVQWELAGGLLKIVRIEGMESMKREFYIVINKKLSLSPIAAAFLEYAGQASSAEGDTAPRTSPMRERRGKRAVSRGSENR